MVRSPLGDITELVLSCVVSEHVGAVAREMCVMLMDPPTILLWAPAQPCALLPGLGNRAVPLILGHP